MPGWQNGRDDGDGLECLKYYHRQSGLSAGRLRLSEAMGEGRGRGRGNDEASFSRNANRRRSPRWDQGGIGGGRREVQAPQIAST